MVDSAYAKRAFLMSAQSPVNSADSAARASSASAGSTLLELREQLDRTDEEIVRLLARRLETVGLIAQAKAEKASAIRDPERERAVLARVEALASSLGISGPLLRKIYSEIIDYSVSRQVASLRDSEHRALAVAYQGQPLTYNQLAAEQYVAGQGLAGHFIGLASLAQVVDQLTSAQVDLAFLPIESTMSGSLNQVYDVLRERDVHVVGEESFKVALCLAATTEVPLAGLRRILAHPLALDQCSAFIDGLPQLETVPAADSRDAMRLVAEAKDPTLAAIGPPEAARAHGLTIVRTDIGNQDEIFMRYVALARAPLTIDARVACKTSLILSTRHEKGALLRCLQALGECDLSLTKLESRPRPNRPWEYMFFIDFEGNLADARVTAALEAVRREALYMKVLGCYPKAGPASSMQAG